MQSERWLLASLWGGGVTGQTAAGADIPLLAMLTLLWLLGRSTHGSSKSPPHGLCVVPRDTLWLLICNDCCKLEISFSFSTVSLRCAERGLRRKESVRAGGRGGFLDLRSEMLRVSDLLLPRLMLSSWLWCLRHS